MARDLITALRSRVASYHQGDRSAVLADEALAEAGELLSRSTTQDGGVPLGVAEVVAWVRYMRSAELPADQRRADLQAALELFGAIALVDRSLVPAEILRRLDTGAEAEDPPPAELGFAAGLANDSVALRMRYQRTGNPGTLSLAVQLGRHAMAAARRRASPPCRSGPAQGRCADQSYASPTAPSCSIRMPARSPPTLSTALTLQAVDSCP